MPLGEARWLRAGVRSARTYKRKLEIFAKEKEAKVLPFRRPKSLRTTA
jgi:hypothetical protein